MGTATSTPRFTLYDREAPSRNDSNNVASHEEKAIFQRDLLFVQLLPQLLIPLMLALTFHTQYCQGEIKFATGLP